jgi:type I restriction enzyme R subunit
MQKCAFTFTLMNLTGETFPDLDHKFNKVPILSGHPFGISLAHIAYALPPLTREERAAKAKVIISTRFNSKQQVFLDFVLSHYVNVGVEELDQEKLTPLLRLKYHNSIADAVADLGKPDEIGKVFNKFQKYLYQAGVAA